MVILHDFASWWARQMLSLMPARLTPDATRADAITVSLRDATDSPLDLGLRRRQRETAIGSFRRDEAGLRAATAALRSQPRAARRHIVLRIPGVAMLERLVTLPLAAERDLERVIGYEMDRLTPFLGDQVYWKASVCGRDRAGARLQARLLLVPKSALATIIAALARIGGVPRAVEAAGPNGATQRIDLLPAAVSRHRGRIVALSAGLAGGLALAALTLPFVSQALERGRVEQAIASLQPQADQATELRRRIAAGAAGADIIAAERAAVGDALQILAKVTDLMPDDTVLSELSLRQGRLAISGQSQSAARLIPALAADPLIRNPAFVAPVTRAPTSPGGNGVSTDLFSIHAELGS